MSDQVPIARETDDNLGGGFGEICGCWQQAVLDGQGDRLRLIDVRKMRLKSVSVGIPNSPRGGTFSFVYEQRMTSSD